MPLPLPNLDGRRWSDLVDEGRALIPRYAPTWTDHNIHDPGITLVELLAWLTEMDVYRTNQVPDRHIRKFLSLVGYAQLPPQPAQAALTLTGTAVVNAGAEFSTVPGIRFLTLRTITVSPATLDAVQSADSTGALHDRAGAFLDHGAIDFETALYLGFSAVPAGVPFTLYFRLAEQGGGGVQLAWEAFTAGSWTAITPSLDQTKSLILDGEVELTLPAGITQVALGPDVPTAFFYLRARIVHGSYDAKPLIADIAVNTTLAEQSVPASFTTAVLEPALTLPNAPVVRDTVEVFTGLDQWERREDFDASHRTDFHFTLDPTLGRITFGDGEHGRTVVRGAVVQVNYRTTVAMEGDVDPAAITVSTVPGITVTNRAPAFGGAPLEDWKTAAGRAVAVLYSHDPRSPHPPINAVTLQDYERLALSVPDTRVARAKAYASLHAGYPCLTAPGVVTVVVIPDLHVPKPTPSPELLRAVYCWLDRRRMVCTQIQVTGPQYLEVSVRATLKLLEYADPESTRQAVLDAINKFLDPLLWPFGRDVYRSEVLAVIDGVRGVDHVLSLSLSADSGAGNCGNVSLCATWLVSPGVHRILVTKEEA